MTIQSTRRLTMVLLALVFVPVSVVNSTNDAHASGYGNCGDAPRDQWRKIEDAEAAAKAAGYRVRKSKVDGTCYEVYGIKDGSLFELFYNPVTMKHVHTIKLR